jgi:hypothetical protein
MGLPASKDIINAYLEAGAAGYILEQEAVELLPGYLKSLAAFLESSSESSSL